MENNQLKALIERIERVQEEIDNSTQDRKEIYLEAKSAGFDAKIIRKLVAVRKKRAEAVAEENELLRTYAEALGMQSDFGF